MKNYPKQPKEVKKKYKFIAFIYIPFLFLLSFAFGSWIAKLLNFQIDLKGVLFALCGLTVVYLITIKYFFAKVREKETKDSISSGNK